MQQFIVMLVMFIISYALTPKPKIQDAESAALDIPRPKPGEPLPVIYGEVWVNDAAVTYFGNPNVRPIYGESPK